MGDNTEATELSNQISILAAYNEITSIKNPSERGERLRTFFRNLDPITNKESILGLFLLPNKSIILKYVLETMARAPGEYISQIVETFMDVGVEEYFANKAALIIKAYLGLFKDNVILALKSDQTKLVARAIFAMQDSPEMFVDEISYLINKYSQESDRYREVSSLLVSLGDLLGMKCTSPT